MVILVLVMAATTASPISRVPTLAVPSLQMSAVRSPAASTAASVTPYRQAVADDRQRFLSALEAVARSGYVSVRVPASRQEVSAAEELYARMRNDDRIKLEEGQPVSRSPAGARTIARHSEESADTMTRIIIAASLSLALAGAGTFPGALVIKDGVAYVQAGAGIVYDSVPRTELEECRSKAGALVEAVAMAESVSDARRERRP